MVLRRREAIFYQKEASKIKHNLNLPEILPKENEAIIKHTHRVKVKSKQHSQIHIKRTLEERAMHGTMRLITVRYCCHLNKDADVDKVKTNRWLKVHGLKQKPGHSCIRLEHGNNIVLSPNNQRCD
jgi:hypothetical protein